MQNAVKIGLLVAADSVPFWLTESIAQLRDSDYAEFPLILKLQSAAEDSAADPDVAPSSICPISSATPATGFAHAGFRLYQKIDARLKRRQPNYDTAIALSQTLPDAEIFEYRMAAPSSADEVTGSQQAAAEKMREHAIDFLLDTGSAITDPALGKLARLGIWSFCNGNGARFNQQPSGFWELTTNAAVSAIALEMVNGNAGETSRISVSTHLPDILLLGRQRQNVMMQAAGQLVTAVRRLHNEGTDKFSQRVKSQEIVNAGNEARYPYPNNWQMLIRMLAHALRYAKLKVRKLIFFEQWILLLHHNPDQSNPAVFDLSEFHRIYPPGDRIWADPFVVADKNDPDKFHIFIEEMEFSVGHGHISVLTVDSQCNYDEAVPVIKHPYHMSYPFIFEYRNEMYMIPETGESSSIQLYRCVNFPHQWEFVKYLMEDVFAVDTNVLEVDGRWWMFTTIRDSEHTDCLDHLQIFHADSPLSDHWQPHVNNPVSQDVRTARLAGDFIQHEGKLFRPSQDGGYHYGWGMKISEVVQLDDEDYVEREVRAIKPGWHWSVIATHTLNQLNGMSASDARVLRPRLMRWIQNRLG